MSEDGQKTAEAPAGPEAPQIQRIHEFHDEILLIVLPGTPPQFRMRPVRVQHLDAVTKRPLEQPIATPLTEMDGYARLTAFLQAALLSKTQQLAESGGPSGTPKLVVPVEGGRVGG